MKATNEITNFKNCVFFKEGDQVKLSTKVSDFKFGNTTTPQYIVDQLSKDKTYTITMTTPIMKTVGGDQQFLSLEVGGTYPCWCFELI